MNHSSIRFSRRLFLLIGLIAAWSANLMGTPRAMPNQAGRREASRSDTILKFFYLVNESERAVQIKVYADKQPVLVQEIGSKVEKASAAEEVPSPARYPARELKVTIRKSVKRLTVEEVNSGLKKQAKIADVMKVDAGIRIVIQKTGILIAQDYFPIR